jgi:hypothetical protein
MYPKSLQEIVIKAHEQVTLDENNGEPEHLNKKLLQLFSELRNYFEDEETKSIFEPLKQRYAHCLKPDINNVRLVQSSSTVWLEITEQIFSDSQDQTIHRIDLSFIKHIKTKQLLFPPENQIEDNASKLVDSCDPYLINVAIGRYLFRPDFCRELLIRFSQEIELSQWQLL